jgi:hypothetical protein
MGIPSTGRNTQAGTASPCPYPVWQNVRSVPSVFRDLGYVIVRSCPKCPAGLSGRFGRVREPARPRARGSFNYTGTGLGFSLKETPNPLFVRFCPVSISDPSPASPLRGRTFADATVRSPRLPSIEEPERCRSPKLIACSRVSRTGGRDIATTRRAMGVRRFSTCGARFAPSVASRFISQLLEDLKTSPRLAVASRTATPPSE